jgi:hypothetical protein
MDPGATTFELPARPMSVVPTVAVMLTLLVAANCTYCTATDGGVGFWIVDVVVVALLVVFTSWRTRGTTRVTVGADGMLVSRGRAAEFVAWRDAEEVRLTWAAGRERIAATLEVPRARGAPLKLECTPAGSDTLRELYHRAQAAHASVTQSPHGTPAAAFPLARAGRDAATWLRELRALTTRGADYRSSAVTEEVLWSVVEDPRVDPTARAGAAAALAESTDESARARIRVAAESTASPKLRVALERIAGAQGDELVEGALEGVEESATRG